MARETTTLGELEGLRGLVRGVILERNGMHAQIVTAGEQGVDELAIWTDMLATFGTNLGAAVGAGPPRVISSVHDDRVLVFGIADETALCLESSELPALGVLIMKARAWVESELSR